MEQREIKFYSHTKGVYRCFSNFYQASITINGKTWPTTEHYFQALKFIYNPEYQEKIRAASNPYAAKSMGRSKNYNIDSDWDLKRHGEFSGYDFIYKDDETGEKYIPHIVEHFLKHRPPYGTLINVTFPKRGTEIKGFRLARQGRNKWFEVPDQRLHPEGHSYYWLGGRMELEREKDELSDITLLTEGYITAVPIQVLNLTNESYLQDHKEGFDSLFSNIETYFPVDSSPSALVLIHFPTSTARFPAA